MLRRTALVLALVGLTVAVHAARPRVRLSGPWRFQFDRDEVGVDGQWRLEARADTHLEDLFVHAMDRRQSARITVGVNGAPQGGSMRWFALQEYTDTIGWLHALR